MNIQIKGTNLELTEPLKNYVNEKIGNLEHYSNEIQNGRVELETSTRHQKGFFRCEVNLDMPHMAVIRAESTEPDLYAAIDLVVPKLREQIERHKGRAHGEDRRLQRYMKTIFAWRPWKKS
ncbi:MAG: ribosomal subunit interface protein [Candidatus Doudnabacteria bacterium RIFCSPHIGHO2_02_FULL_48_21]|uniref:Ribosomal subunit interface protein n=1 Tax=Candidatus Doudnabacteria bacterium RIFCSPLOWO2_02_FULL_48_13 TaxID=1817845 RepID=A0A1F5Q8B0_9BACT|nr:MAG: ribosomal subunit interface protein [Candidatus Doudnabacteria bacterium RIFCSPHIGHO2_01_48_18]OGE77144.1 MAG: ribosomal subunit interface protein [Candidatus Doudnabacteria bacterium RIFCSPHIGHO2_01_FULL_48_180]OGE91593.1 MAG: ribosomal subunit interface protein [Candidatus Doudnabacteria bacterium RIFCSPHIGHO2_12_FULL_47_25]OGE93856.1 MAG: ribosomal subunit interface protein [Candidatus Doudnabacteria bacterium RIFCSPHIGHO2_02_FULL_48_21]OGE97651.1 MAG: ribosomal subunit interface pro